MREDSNKSKWLSIGSRPKTSNEPVFFNLIINFLCVQKTYQGVRYQLYVL